VCGVLLPLSPGGAMRMTWDLLLGFIITYNIIVIPVRVAFEIDLDLNVAFDTALVVVEVCMYVYICIHVLIYVLMYACMYCADGMVCRPSSTRCSS